MTKTSSHLNDTISMTSFRKYQHLGRILLLDLGGGYMSNRFIIVHNKKAILLYFINFSVIFIPQFFRFLSASTFNESAKLTGKRPEASLKGERQQRRGRTGSQKLQ